MFYFVLHYVLKCFHWSIATFETASPDIKLIPECNSAGFANSALDFEICAQSVNYVDTILSYFPSEQKFKEFSLFSSTYSKNSSFKGFSSALEI